MFTSYFANLKNITSPLSISAKAPSWYKGPQLKILAPRYSTLMAYKNGEITEQEYREQFYDLVLAPLSAAGVYQSLIDKYGQDVTLLCYEKPGDFCHRRIVAEWIRNEAGIEIPELPVIKVR